METEPPAPQGHTPTLSATLTTKGNPCVDFTIDGKELDGVWITPETIGGWHYIVEAVNSHTRLQSENRALREALEELLFVHENADETGYVDGVGFVRGFDQLPDKCRSALLTTLNPTEQKK